MDSKERWAKGCPTCGDTERLIEQQLCWVNASYRIDDDGEQEYIDSEFGDEPVVAVIGHRCLACGRFELDAFRVEQW